MDVSLPILPPTLMQTELDLHISLVAHADLVQKIDVTWLVPSRISFSEIACDSTSLVWICSTGKKALLTTSIIEVASLTLLVRSSLLLLCSTDHLCRFSTSALHLLLRSVLLPPNFTYHGSIE